MYPRIFAGLFATIALGLVAMPVALAEEEGQDDLDRAIEAKLTAESLRELGLVINLCQSALTKGLDEENAEFATKLLSATLVQRAEAVSGMFLDAAQPDQHWSQLRRVALADLERALELDAEQPAANLLLGRLHLLPGGDRERAAGALDEAVRLLRDDNAACAEALLLRSAARDDADQRLADLNEAVTLAPRQPKYRRARGAAHLARGKAEDALADFDAALSLEPEDAPTHEARGLALGMLERWDEARASYNRAAELLPDSPDPIIQRGRLNLLAGDAESAIKDNTEALAVDPDNIAALVFRSEAYLQAQRPDNALADLNRALELRPGLIPALRNRAVLLATTGRVDEAIDDLEQLSQEDPENALVRMQLGMCYSNERQFGKAIEAYTEALQRDGRNWAIYRSRADTYLTIGKQREAIADYNAALKLDPENSGILNNLAWVLATSPDEQLRDAKRAIELALKACEVTEYSQPHILSTLAAGYAEQGDFQTAIRWSKKAVETAAGPENAEMRENLEKELASYQAGNPWRELQNEPESPPADGDSDENDGEAEGDEPEEDEPNADAEAARCSAPAGTCEGRAP